MDNLTIIIPFFNGEKTIRKLLDCIPPGTAPILIVDDLSDVPYQLNRDGTKVIRLKEKGYFTGAVNYGLSHTETDVLILNQDAQFLNTDWIDFINGYRSNYAMIGERIKGDHPVWTKGYIQGTFMFIRRDAIEKVGLMNEVDYPLWGSTCEYQLRVCRENLPVLIVEEVPGFIHQRDGKFGTAITTLLKREPAKVRRFICTPPEVSVIIPCYNYGKYVTSAVNSLVGGKTDLGEFSQQTFSSFEVVIVDDGSDKRTASIIQGLVNPLKGVRAVRRDRKGGTAAAINTGIKNAYGKYITILGADDMRKTDALEKLYRKLQKDTHTFVYDGVEAFAKGKMRPDLIYKVSPFNFEKLLYKNHIHAGIMYAKKAWEEIDGYPEVFDDGREDWAVNLALGVKGYCGVYIEDYSGYLYRREGHNRSLRNTNRNDRNVFLGKLQMLFPEIYKGERPEMCCGGKKKPVLLATKKGTKSKGVVLMDTEKMVLLEYIGRNFGKASFYGVKTGNQYRAGKSHPIIGVDKSDLLGTSIRPGLLDLRENGKSIFRLYQLPGKKVEPEKPVLEKAVELVQETIAPEKKQAGHKMSGIEVNYAPYNPQDNLLNSKTEMPKMVKKSMVNEVFDDPSVSETVVKKSHPVRKATAK